MLVGEKLHTCVINGVLQWWGVRVWPDKGLLYSTPGHQGMGISAVYIRGDIFMNFTFTGPQHSSLHGNFRKKS